MAEEASRVIERRFPLTDALLADTEGKFALRSWLDAAEAEFDGLRRLTGDLGKELCTTVSGAGRTLTTNAAVTAEVDVSLATANGTLTVNDTVDATTGSVDIRRGICRSVMGAGLLAVGSLMLLAMPGEAWAESKSRFEASKGQGPAAAVESIDLASERATGLPPQSIAAPDSGTELSIILWDELKRPAAPRPSGGVQTSIGNQASIANGQTLR